MATEPCLLLCFRGLGHYWPLVMRQLALPPKLSGESLPYRARFIYDSIATVVKDAPKKKALICLKIDKSETTNGQSIYVPLRTGVVEQATRATDAAGLLRIFYKAEYTPDYKNKDCLAYSELVRAAVKARTKDAEIGDCGLVMLANLDIGLLNCADGSQESDRWVRLSRAVGVDSKPLVDKLKAENQEVYKEIYWRLMFVRWSAILKGGDKVAIGPQGYELTVGEQYRLEMVSSLPPEFVSKIFRWELRGSPKHFDFFDWSTEIGPGIAHHKLPLEPKRAAKSTSLRLSPSNTAPQGPSGSVPDATREPHQFDVHMELRLKDPCWLKPVIFLVLVALTLGVLFSSGVFNNEVVGPLRLSSKSADTVQDFVPGAGAALLIIGGLGSYWLTSRRSD